MPTKACPSRVELEQLLEEQLDDRTREAVSSHVDGCPQCQAALERLTEQEEEHSVPSTRHLQTAASAPPAETTPAPFLARLKRLPPPTTGPAAAPGAGQASDAAGLPTVPGYEILGVLGRGGMGVVYKARQVGLNRVVALKMILAGAHTGPKGMARFLAEAEAVAGLRHPNIVQIYDIGEASGSPYFALEFLEGGSLARQLGGGPQPVESAVRLIETLARAVHFAHEQGIVHRDLKPANVLLSRRASSLACPAEEGKQGCFPYGYDPKITDFGLAKRLNEQSTGTQTGEVVGTPSYMAPEQAGGKMRRIGAATDVWSLGAIFYELLTGRPPFKGATALDTVVQVLHEEPIRPARLRPYLPRDLEIICLKCLEKDPDRRYPSADALADDLKRFRQGKPIEARPVGRLERAAKWARRHPLTAALLAGLFVVTALGFAGVTTQWQEARAARDVAVEERKKARAALYFSRIAQSQLQWRVNDVAGSRQSLEKCLPLADQEDRRGWEWYYLRGQFHADLLTLRHRRGGAGGAVAYRPDGRWIASVVGGHAGGDGDPGGEVRVWDAATGQPVRALAAPGTAHRLAFAPSGDRLALAATDGTVLVWEVTAGRELLRRAHHTKLATGVAFSPDGRHVASSGADEVVQVWDAATGQVRHTLRGHSGRVQGVAYHPGGGLLASAGWDATVRIWDAETGRPVKTLTGHLGPVYAVAFSPVPLGPPPGAAGEAPRMLLASAGSNGNLKIWDVATWRVIQSLTSNTGAVLGVAFSPDGRYLAYGGGDATVRVWDVESGVERFVFRGHTAPVESVQFSPDGTRLVSASPTAAAAVKVWDLTRHPEQATFARTRGRDQGAIKVRDLTRPPGPEAATQTGPDVEALAFNANGDRLTSVTVGGTLQTWDAATGVLLHQHAVAMSADLISPAVLAGFSASGEYLAARAREDARVVKVWDAATGKELAALTGHTLPVLCVRFAPATAGGQLVTCACDVDDPGGPHEVKVWQVPGGKPLAALTGRGQILSAALSPDGRWLALGRRDGVVALVDWARPRRTVQVPAHKGPVGAVAFSPDGRTLATAGLEDRTLHLWDLTGLGAQKPPRSGHPLAAPPFLCDLAFSPDGKRLAGVSRDVVKMWDFATGHEVLTLRGAPQRHWDPAFNPRVLFTPDGKRLAATNWDETISLWEAETPAGDAEAARLQARRREAADARGPFWHLQEAEDCLTHDNRPAALFHFRRLGAAALPAPLQARKDRLALLLKVES